MTTTSAAAIRRYAGPALLERGFRPFFLGAGLFATFAVPLWIWALMSGLFVYSEITTIRLHIHEMVFGYPSAVIAGFLLTATPNWTGRLPVIGTPLAALFLIWVAGRLAMLTQFIGYPGSAAIDAAFLTILAGLLWREILPARNIRNIPVCVLLTLLAAMNIAFHVLQATGGDTDIAIRAALGLITTLIMLIGGRVVPSFTHNWLAKKEGAARPKPFSAFDRLAIAVGILTIICWIGVPNWTGTALCAALAACLHLARLARWRGWTTFGEPLVTVLHAGYLWLPIWFGLLAASNAQIGPFSQSAAIHALTAGAIGTMTLAIMSRAILGHGGGSLHAGPGTVAVYLLVIAAAIIRVLAEVLPANSEAVMVLSAGFWSAGFGLFVILFGPLCVKRRKPATMT